MDGIELYKPAVSLSETFKVDETLDEKQQAFIALKNISLARRAQEAMFLVMGKLLTLVRDRKLFKYLDFEHFEEFLASEEVSVSRESAYLYIRVYEYYSGFLGLGEEQLKDIQLSRLGRMIPLLKDVKSKEEAMDKIEQMSKLTHNDFIREVKSVTNKDGKPTVFWSEEEKKWIIEYFFDTCKLVAIGNYADRQSE